MGTSIEPIRKTVTVQVPVKEAFSFFIDKLSEWWPAEYTWSQNVLEHIAITPRKNGRCYESGPHGFECDWGRVLEYDPPDRVVFTWQISPRREPEPNPDKASEVEVQFKASGEAGTLVELEHRNIERHGDGAEEYFKGLNSPMGWEYMLDKYVTRLAESRN